MASEGASNNERLIAAARSDNEEMLLEVFEQGNYDINCQDGLGNTPLHYAAGHGYLTILEHILEHDGCDVDPVNRLEKATPLHLALRLENPEVRRAVVESLLEAGAETKIKDKHGETALDLVSPNDVEIRALMRKVQAQASISRDDVASDEDEDEGSTSSSTSED